MTTAADAAPIHVVLPAHLCQLARTGKHVTLVARPTQRGVIDALERHYPALTGTLRDPATGRRRAFVRFFACQEDLSHEQPDNPLPAAVADGTEPLLIIGAMAGG